MEMMFLGAKTTLIESRDSLDRNNVIKLWSFVMEDLKSLGAKKLYPGLGNGSVNHISIKMLQMTLLKIALIVGTNVYIRDVVKIHMKYLSMYLGINLLASYNPKNPNFQILTTVCRETFRKIVAPTTPGGKWSVLTDVRCEDGSVYQCQEHFDVVICATGRKVPIKGADLYIDHGLMKLY